MDAAGSEGELHAEGFIKAGGASLRAPLTDSDAGRNSFIPAEIQIPV
jgi:hypothetical protein